MTKSSAETNSTFHVVGTTRPSTAESPVVYPFELIEVGEEGNLGRTLSDEKRAMSRATPSIVPYDLGP